jgi:hypothetical protein
MARFIALSFVATFLMVLVAGCGDGDGDSDGYFSCLFERRKTTGCDGQGFGSWESGCARYDFELREGLSREQACREYAPAGGDLHCQAGCCIRYEFRNVRVGSLSACP